MEKIVLNGSAMTTRADAHDEIARAMGLPGYYGRNLDALWDALGECEREITLKDAAVMLNALGVYGCKLLQTFYEAEKTRFRAE